MSPLMFTFGCFDTPPPGNDAMKLQISQPTLVSGNDSGFFSIHNPASRRIATQPPPRRVRRECTAARTSQPRPSMLFKITEERLSQVDKQALQGPEQGQWDELMLPNHPRIARRSVLNGSLSLMEYWKEPSREEK